MAPAPLWSPSAEQVSGSRIAELTEQINASRGTALPVGDYDPLYDWSIEHPAAFWSELWTYAGIVHSEAPTQVMGTPRMPGTEWFAGARLNFAENLLRRRDDGVALAFVHESGAGSHTTFAELSDQVARVAEWLRSVGVVAGDRVAAFMPNRPEAVVAMLATSSIGAIWSSCSPDFGFKGVMDRFGQIGPKVLLACDGYTYGGKSFSCVDRVARVADEIDAIEHVLLVPVLGEDAAAIPGQVVPWATALDRTPGPLEFAQLPFDHPLYIMYSSGTTGVPKCIVHGQGGTLLQHAKELMLHNDLRPDDALFYFTTCGWMMWNWLVSGLMAGSAVVLFDGSPAYPDVGVLWRMAEAEGVTHFGTSPRFLGSCAKAGYLPGEHVDLSRLRAVMSTGSPLSVELFEWTYAAVKADLQLASICGGTDIISCFMLGSPVSPVYAGEIQKRGLAMRVEAWSDGGDPVVGQKAELVCAAPFPSMPTGFWQDPDGEKYGRAYFRRYPGVWHHGDYIELTERGGVIVYGRSDATLNPGGVRIGTAEIYRQVEALDEVVDSIVIGQRTADDDTRVVLFVVPRPELTLDDALVAKIKRHIRSTCSPRHVPAVVLQVDAVPRTISGKKVEVAVTRTVHGEAVANRDALANPEALDQYAGRPELS